MVIFQKTTFLSTDPNEPIGTVCIFSESNFSCLDFDAEKWEKNIYPNTTVENGVKSTRRMSENEGRRKI